MLPPHTKGMDPIFSVVLTLFFFFFFWAAPMHMEVPNLRIESKLKLLAYTTATAILDPSCLCDLPCSLQQCQILNPLSEARDQTHVLMDTSQICYLWVTTGTLTALTFWCFPSFCVWNLLQANSHLQVSVPRVPNYFWSFAFMKSVNTSYQALSYLGLAFSLGTTH